MSLEIWKPTFNSNYEVSNLGRVRSRLRKWRTSDGFKILKCRPDTHGYPTVTLWADRKRVGTYRVHRLVAAAFIGPCPEGQDVRHKNADRSDTRAQNLEYGTKSQNMQDAVKLMALHMQKLTPAQVSAICAAKGIERQVDLAERYGVGQSHISAIQRKEKWACLE